MASRRNEIHAALSGVLGVSVTLLLTACSGDGGDRGTMAAAAGGGLAFGGVGTWAGGAAPIGTGGVVNATAGGSVGTGGIPGLGGAATAAGGASSSGGVDPGAGGDSAGGDSAGGDSAGGAATGGSGSGSGGDGAGGSGGSGPGNEGCDVLPIPDDVRSRYRNMNEPYYVKYAATSGGILVATGSQVDDEAIVRYCRLLTEMFSNEKVRQPALAQGMWFTMISENEQLSSLPQINRTYGTSLNMRARGLGGLTPTICAEDSIMCMPGDPWVNDCICPHEAGHTLYSSGIARDPDLSGRLTEITDAARASGRLANAYVWQDGVESGMMSWGVQAWYNCAINGNRGTYHSDINTREELQRELPEFYAFLSELLPTDNEYEDCYAGP